MDQMETEGEKGIFRLLKAENAEMVSAHLWDEGKALYLTIVLKYLSLII